MLASVLVGALAGAAITLALRHARGLTLPTTPTIRAAVITRSAGRLV